jgi:hypothetical protein
MSKETRSFEATLLKPKGVGGSSSFHSRKHMRQTEMEQLEAYISLVGFLQPRFPFPIMNGGAIPADLGLLFASKIVETRPALIVEAGSGVSTIIAGYCVKKNGRGRVVSLEHDLCYVEKTRKAVSLHGLEDFVTVVHAPLCDHSIHGERCVWYDTSSLIIESRTIEVLLVDGPPGRLRRLSRYPALPILDDRLSSNPTIFVDDCRRDDETEMVSLWLRDFPFLRSTCLKTARGGLMLSGKR